MTDTTVRRVEYQPGGQARNDLLYAAIEGMSADERRDVCSHLLGGLACYVDDATFESVLAAALASVGRHG